MQCYKALDYKRFSFFDLMKKIFKGTFKARSAKADQMGIQHDLKGDGFQNGGALIIAKGGKQLFEYIQEDASIQITEEQILKALKLNWIWNYPYAYFVMYHLFKLNFCKLEL